MGFRLKRQSSIPPQGFIQEEAIEGVDRVKHEETALKQDKQAFLQEFKRLKTNGVHPSVDETKARQNAAVLNNLSRQGIIDDNGNPTQQSKRPQ